MRAESQPVGSSRYFRYVPHNRVTEYAAIGWSDRGPAPGHHAQWSHVMRWEGAGEPVEPMTRAEGGDDAIV